MWDEIEASSECGRGQRDEESREGEREEGWIQEDQDNESEGSKGEKENE